MAVYGLGSPEAKMLAINRSSLDCPVRKLHIAPKIHVFFRYIIPIYGLKTVCV